MIMNGIIRDKAKAQHLLKFCKEKGIKGEQNGDWFIVSSEDLPKVIEESKKYDKTKLK